MTTPIEQLKPKLRSIIHKKVEEATININYDINDALNKMVTDKTRVFKSGEDAEQEFQNVDAGDIVWEKIKPIGKEIKLRYPGLSDWIDEVMEEEATDVEFHVMEMVIIPYDLYDIYGEPPIRPGELVSNVKTN